MLTAHWEYGHAEQPGTDGWFHACGTGNATLTISGPPDLVRGVAQDLRDRGASFTLGTFHDGPGAESCVICATSTSKSSPAAHTRRTA